MRANLRTWIFAALAFGVSAALVRVSTQRTELLGAALTAKEHRHEVLARAVAENARLRAAQPSEAEQTAMEQRDARADALRSQIATLGQKISAARLSDSPDGRVGKGDWTFDGNTTPRAALMSVLWSASRGDVDELASLLAFGPAAREKADAIYASLPLDAQQEYGSPEKVVATLLSGSFPKDASSADISGVEELGDNASVEMRIGHTGGEPRNNTYRLDHSDGGWRLLVPDGVLDGYAKTLQGQPDNEATDGR